MSVHKLQTPRQPLKTLLKEALPKAEPAPGVQRRVLLKIQAAASRKQRPAAALWTGGLAAAVLVGISIWIFIPTAPELEGQSPVLAQQVTFDGKQQDLYSLQDGTRILARPETDAVVKFGKTESLVSLEQGSVVVHASPQNRRSFKVVSGALQVFVVGTVFEVGRDETGERLSVLEGQVRVEDGAGSHTLSAGQSYPSSKRSTVTPQELRLIQAPAAAVAGAAAQVEPSTAPARGESDAGATASEPSAPPQNPGAEPSVQVEAIADQVEEALVPSSEEPDALAEQTTRAQHELRFSRAKAQERAGNLRDAYALYESLAWSGGKNAHDALYAAGRLSLELGERSRARRLFDAYRGMFPGGYYARAVDVHSLRLWLRDGNDAAVLRESNRFLRKFGSDSRAAQFALAKARVLSRRGDCTGALALIAKTSTKEAEQLRSSCHVRPSATTISPNKKRKDQ